MSARRVGLLQLLAESTGLKVALFFAAIGAAAVWVAKRDLRPDLRHLHATMLSGSPRGHYHALVAQVAERAASKRGRLTNQPTRGSIENARQLVEERRTCRAHFALVQDGLDWRDHPGLEIVGVLPKSESVFFLGREADRLISFGQLKALRIGVGPSGGGTSRVAEQLFSLRGLSGLRPRLSHHELADQLALVERGALDLAMMIIDEDAALVEEALVLRGLQVASFAQLDVVARRLPFARVGRIGAGQYDPVHLVPQVDKRVLRIDTLVLGNGCASRSQTVGLLRVLSEVFPALVRHNKEGPSHAGLPVAAAARAYYEGGGPDLVDEYVPWLVDIMPTSNWVYIVMGLSVLFNVMSFGHRFRLWRIDARRVQVEQRLASLFPGVAVPEEFVRRADELVVTGPEACAVLTETGERIERLAARCRRQSLSILVPMGQEMAYRYQEQLMQQMLAALRSVLGRSAPCAD
ncbi:MAG: hypothetical protein IT371_22650 [Deltaproteobacteria bacterium]|nr:hypothetical protein [Deltaproteobacteria bacterium]